MLQLTGIRLLSATYDSAPCDRDTAGTYPVYAVYVSTGFSKDYTTSALSGKLCKWLLQRATVHYATAMRSVHSLCVPNRGSALQPVAKAAAQGGTL
jgi:hypothetical protein